MNRQKIEQRIRESRLEQKPGNRWELTFSAIGTVCRVIYYLPDATLARRLSVALMSWLADFELTYSRFIPDSLISRINAAAGSGAWTAIDPATEQLFLLCDRMHFATRALFDPTMLPLIRLWDYRNPQPRVPTDAELQAALALVNWKRVQREPGRILLPEPGMALDLGGIGKEFAVDQAALLLKRSGVAAGLVDFGRDIRTFGAPPEHPTGWRIGLERPGHEKPWGSSLTMDVGIATSGNYLRYFEADGKRYGHILDPRTGRPVDNEVQVASVFAASCTEAGILSTCAIILGASEGLELIQRQPAAEGAVLAEKEFLTTRGFHRYAAKNPEI